MRVRLERNTRWIWCILLVLGMMVAGCGKAIGPQAGHLRYLLGGEPESLDPRLSTSAGAAMIQAQLFEGLTTMDAAGNILPAAAERWEVSPDGLTYRFYLRPEGRWSDGTPVRAMDFEYAWKTGLSPELGASFAYQLYYLRNGEAYNQGKASVDSVGVRAIDAQVLEIQLEQATEYFLNLTSFHSYYPVSAAIAERDAAWNRKPASFVGNGPFRMQRWVHDHKLELTPNEYYWDRERVKLQRLDFLLIDAPSTSLALFERGQADMGENLPAGELPRLLREGQAQIFPYLGTYFYSFRVDQAPFDQVKVRQAFSMAVNRQVLVDNVTKAGQKPARGFIPPGLRDVAPGSDFRAAGGELIADGDVVGARKLLAEAGYPDGKGFPKVQLLYNTSENHKLIAEALQAMWKQGLNIEVELINQEWKVFLDTLNKGNYQLARDGWIGDYEDPMTFLDLFESNGGNNNPGYKNPAYDKLVAGAKANGDRQQRMQLLHAAEKMIVDEAVVLPLYYYTNTLLIQPYVQGFVRSTLGVIYFKEAYLSL